MGFDQRTVVERDDRLRRDAIARVLAARICDDRRTIAELVALDRLLTKIERVEDGLIELRRQTFWPPQEWPGVDELGGES
jgi:hypothetical protein